MRPEYPITQPYAANYNGSYLASGLLGHSGVDYSGGYGAPIHSIFYDEEVYKLLDKNHTANDGSGFTGVFTLVDNGIEVFEFLYGHGDPCVTLGQKLTPGTVIMTEANHGEVYSGGVRITLSMQASGDKRGNHVHAQKRPLYKHRVMQPDNMYITGQNGAALYKDGFYYAYAFPNNGYAGCVDWTLPLFRRNLTIGMSGYDVQCLQNFLKSRGFLQINQTTQFFGTKTLQAVIAFQRANGISPLLGFVGPATRGLINNILK